MSTLAGSSPIATVHRTNLTELDAVRAISREVSKGVDAACTFEVIARVILRVRGIYQVQIGNEKWGQVPDRASVGSALSGNVRFVFDLHRSVLESPVRFAKFVAQQAAHVGELCGLQRQKADLKTKIDLIGRIIARRKAVHRARAILRNREGLNEAAAFACLVRHSRERRKRLHEIAEAIILSEGMAWRRPFPIRYSPT
jgi:hypothetical protein